MTLKVNITDTFVISQKNPASINEKNEETRISVHRFTFQRIDYVVKLIYHDLLLENPL
jgi:hypothetical protein